MLRELDLTEEELLIINKNEKNAKINIFQNEQKFKILLNEYLKTHKKSHAKPQMCQMTEVVSTTPFCILLQLNTINK